MALDTQSPNSVSAGESTALWTLPDSLVEFVNSGEADMVAEILTLFREDAADRLRKLNVALAEGNRDMVRRQAHTLKGSALQVGALPMSALFRDIEAMAADAPTSELVDLAGRAWECYSRTCLEMPIVN